MSELSTGANCNDTNLSHTWAKLKIKKYRERPTGCVSWCSGVSQGRRKQTEKLRYMQTAQGWHQRSACAMVDKIVKDIKEVSTGQEGEQGGHRLVVKGRLRKALVWWLCSSTHTRVSPGWDLPWTLSSSMGEWGSSQSSTLPGCRKGKQEEQLRPVSSISVPGNALEQIIKQINHQHLGNNQKKRNSQCWFARSKSCQISLI